MAKNPYDWNYRSKYNLSSLAKPQRKDRNPTLFPSEQRKRRKKRQRVNRSRIIRTQKNNEARTKSLHKRVQSNNELESIDSSSETQ